MKEIKLTRGQIALVDDEDFEFLNQWKWHAVKGKYAKTFYAATGSSIKKTYITMHRLLLNCPKDKEVDHQDHNGLNNQRYNLRICTHSQNHMNKRPHGDSKYLGVSWAKDRNKWRAFIQTRQCKPLKRKTLYSGQFNTEIEAAKAYDLKAKELFGEFANLNFK